MAKRFPQMNLKVIGIVRNELERSGHNASRVISAIEVDQSLAEGLDGLEEFSHLIIIYWMHQVVSSPLSLKVHPMRRPDLPLVGLFATRSPRRPNTLGMTVVKFLRREDNILYVEGLDALDGTPVVDIKPYLPHGDAVPNASVATWITKSS